MMRRLSSTLPVSLLFFLCQQQEQQQRQLHSGRENTPKRRGAPHLRRKVSPTASALEHSEDVAQREERLDVEKHFPIAMSHLKMPPVTSYAADERKKQEWKDIVRTVNADGHRFSKDDSGVPPSFFDQGSVDIRSKTARYTASSAATYSRRDVVSPDVLQLSGGTLRQHGMALADESNASPADATIEAESDEEKNVYGDTPLQLTDMLKERLMELKAEKLREDRIDTYLPRRLRLLSDDELQQQHQQQEEKEKKEEAEGLKSLKRSRLKKAPTNLADVIVGDVNDDVSDITSDNQLMSKSQSVSTAMNDIIRKSADLIPGGSSYDPLSGRVGNYDTVLENDSTIPDGSVYLLRCLPRAGFCSRREALTIIASGQVRVDNVVERNPFRLVRAENNIHVASHSGRLRFAPPRLWMYHKPAHVIVSRNDVAGRTLITKHARILGMDHLVPVGSLPMRAHGLLLLTNDGELSRFLENPKSMIQRTYLLRVRPAIDPVLAHKLNTEGLIVNGKRWDNVEFLVNPAMKSRFSLKIKIRGETLPVSHIMQHLGRNVERGGRISFGPFSISGLPVGSVREVTVPPHYTKHSGAVWKEFIERDWPFFRRQRVSRLRRLSRYRELTPKELEELDNFTYEELKDALNFESQELKEASMEKIRHMSVRPSLDEKPLPNDLGVVDIDGVAEIPEEDEIIEDITAVM
ncbi:tRNA pseudouridine synthase A [Trypanosoma theileri]|uniref:tRNA pseudouridine synthase A n=1 Tax=Trypanosoma theileri TaxID=67003 RepID=A0A1X0P7U6_9TRYP|nr:tRNA pseudouridine synthase A [Trypanosoma theileri]ORC93016.1 tRNA pseudouridine synthase A [Trypanosoma theileri]